MLEALATEFRKCSKCGERKSIDGYRLNGLWRMRVCKACGNARRIACFRADPEIKRAGERKRRREKPVAYMLKNAQRRARAAGIEFSLTVADVHIPATCPLLETPIFAGEGSVKPHSPSLDRKNPKKGYVPGNVWVISQKANVAKNNLTSCELLLLATNLKLMEGFSS